MKDDFLSGNGLSLIQPSNDMPLPRAEAAAEKRSGLDENFHWHRIRRMSRK